MKNQNKNTDAERLVHSPTYDELVRLRKTFTKEQEALWQRHRVESLAALGARFNATTFQTYTLGVARAIADERELLLDLHPLQRTTALLALGGESREQRLERFADTMLDEDLADLNAPAQPSNEPPFLKNWRVRDRLRYQVLRAQAGYNPEADAVITTDDLDRGLMYVVESERQHRRGVRTIATRVLGGAALMVALVVGGVETYSYAHAEEARANIAQKQALVASRAINKVSDAAPRRISTLRTGGFN